MEYFSDRESFHKDEKLTSDITIDVWNGITVIVNKLIESNSLAKDFPKYCPDGRGVCGVDEQSFYVASIAIIPGAKVFLPYTLGKIERLSYNFLNSEDVQQTQTFTYDVLDFLEFVDKHIHDVKNGDHHDYYNHYELIFPNTDTEKKQFRFEINHVFERNHIGFKINDDGYIQRTVNEELLRPLDYENIEIQVKELIEQALHKFRNPKIEERHYALEKIWDAFERLKSLNDNQKKESTNILLKKVAKQQEPIRTLLEEECNTLTSIGNKYQIRHFEKDTKQIVFVEHIDYLFYRMYALITLLTSIRD